MHNNDHDPDASEHAPEHGSEDVSGQESGRNHEYWRESDRRQPLADDAPADDHSASRAASEESIIDETLHHALSDLEQMLERHESSGEAAVHARDDQVADEVSIEKSTQQYIIPLLDEVVRPGSEVHASPSSSSANEPRIDHDAETADENNDNSEPAVRRRLAERLASEIEIITQDRIEAALEKAREEIRVQVRNHLDIILPEVVEELSQVRRHRNSDPEH